MAEERLEAEDAGGDQRPDLSARAGNHAAVKAAVDRKLAASSLELLREGQGGRRHGRAVERHVDERGDPAGGGGTRRRDEAFPLGPSWLVDVNVSIDHARQDEADRPRPGCDSDGGTSAGSITLCDRLAP